MRRGIPIAVAVLAVALPASAGAAAPAHVKMTKCAVKEGTAVFQGRMKRVPGTVSMSMRFRLQQRVAPRSIVPVHAKPLERWRRSEPGVRVFRYRQAVRGLVPDGVYRMVVDFRWHGEDGEVLRRARRRSRLCGGEGPLANLRVRVVGARPTRVEGVHRYAVRIWNRGRAPASGFGIGLQVDGAGVDRRNTYSLEPGEWRIVNFHGPACRRSVTAEIDPARVVPESDETDNLHQIACARLYD